MGDNISIIAGIRNSIESSRLEVLNVEDPDSVASNGAALEKKFFVPWAALVELLSRGNIRAVLKECIEITHLYKIDELLDIISNGGGLRVFAILLVIQRPHLIKKLVEKLRLENHHLDSNLPFDPETLFSITEDAEASHQFADRQWEFIAPVFRKDQSYRSFCNRTVLPFTEQEELGRGAFGRIYKVTIPASHMVSEKQEFSKKARLSFL